MNEKRLTACPREKGGWVSQVHAEGEAEHAAIGHGAAASFVPAEHVACMRQAMQDHDRDFAAFYSALANMLQ